MRETAAPMLHRKSRANISPFKRISRCVSLFSLSSIAVPARILPFPSVARFAIPAHPGGKCLRPCWNPCDVGKCRVSDIKECVRLAVRRRCRPSRRLYSYSRHSSTRQTWRSIQAFFAKDNNLHTFPYIFANEERIPRRPVFKITRAHAALPGGGERGDIFLSGD